MHTTKKVKAKPTPELDALALESGRVYSKVVSLSRKIYKKKGLWLSEKSVKKYMRLKGYKLHSHIFNMCRSLQPRNHHLFPSKLETLGTDPN